MENIGDGDKVQIIIGKYSSPERTKDIKKFIGKIGTVTSTDVGYQAPTMYLVIFSLKPFIQENFFEWEVKKI